MGKKLLRVSHISVMLFGASVAALSLAPALAVEAVPIPPVAESTVATVEAQAQPIPKAPVVVKPAPLFQHTTYPLAWTAAQKSNRPILVYVSMPNCPHCVKMVNESYQQPTNRQLIAGSFETIKAGRYTHAKLVSKLHVKWYPTTVLVGPNNKILDVIEGYVGPKQLQQRLQTGLASLSKPTATTQIR